MTLSGVLIYPQIRLEGLLRKQMKSDSLVVYAADNDFLSKDCTAFKQVFPSSHTSPQQSAINLSDYIQVERITVPSFPT